MLYIDFSISHAFLWDMIGPGIVYESTAAFAVKREGLTGLTAAI